MIWTYATTVSWVWYFTEQQYIYMYEIIAMYVTCYLSIGDSYMMVNRWYLYKSDTRHQNSCTCLSFHQNNLNVFHVIQLSTPKHHRNKSQWLTLYTLGARVGSFPQIFRLLLKPRSPSAAEIVKNGYKHFGKVNFTRQVLLEASGKQPVDDRRCHPQNQEVSKPVEAKLNSHQRWQQVNK